MRVLITTDTVGGVWDHALSLARGLHQRNVDVRLAACGPLAQDHQKEAGAVLHHIEGDLEWMPGGPAAVDTVRRRLQDIVRQEDVDLVHANAYSHVLPNVPTVLGAHSSLHGWWRAVRDGLPPPPEWEPYRQIVGGAVEKAAAVVAPTRAMLDEVSTYGSPRRGLVIPNGTSVYAAPGAAFGAAADAPPRGAEGTLAADRLALAGPAARSRRTADHFILAGGRLWDEGKGHQILDQAAARLRWPVHATGSPHGPQGVVAFRHLRLLGHLPRAELAERYRRAALYVNPALYEPFGLGALEAALHGRPLVLTDLPSHREVWGAAASYVPPGDADVLADTLHGLMADEEARAELAATCHARAVRFSQRAMADAYHRLYEEILEETLCAT